METPLLYTAENHIDGDLQAFRNWYAWRHAPDVWRLGFLSCASYRCVEGDMSIFGIYEIPSADLFSTAAYQAIPVKDPHREKAAGSIVRRAHTLYDQTELPTRAFKGPLGRLDADWISAIRFDCSDRPQALTAWFAERTIPDARLRLAQRSVKERPNSVTDRPKFMIVAEWAREPPKGATAWKAFCDHLANTLTNVSYFTGQRLYPWPDTAA